CPRQTTDPDDDRTGDAMRLVANAALPSCSRTTPCHRGQEVLRGWALAAIALAVASCAGAGGGTAAAVAPVAAITAPTPDPRVGLAPGLLDAGEAIWNLRLLSSTPPPPDFVGVTNSDLA